MSAHRPVFASNPPFDVIHALVQPPKGFGVLESATFGLSEQPLDTWYTHTRFANTLDNQRSRFLLLAALLISCPEILLCRAICRMPNKNPLWSTLKALNLPFFTPRDAQASKANGPRARCLYYKSTAPQAQHFPCPCSWAGFPGTYQENEVHTTCHSRCRLYVDGRAQHTRRILVHLCQHVEAPVSGYLPACHDTACTELCKHKKSVHNVHMHTFRVARYEP
jgi:hypothetical protein